MHQSEQEKCARERRKAETLLDIMDEINSARRLVEAAEMAANSLAQHESAPLAELLALIGARLKTVVANMEARQAPDAA